MSKQLCLVIYHISSQKINKKKKNPSIKFTSREKSSGLLVYGDSSLIPGVIRHFLSAGWSEFYVDLPEYNKSKIYGRICFSALLYFVVISDATKLWKSPWGTGTMQWWGRLPSFHQSDSGSITAWWHLRVDFAVVGFRLASRVFLQVFYFMFSSLHKNQHFDTG